MSNELKPLHFDADYTMEEALAEAKRCLKLSKTIVPYGFALLKTKFSFHPSYCAR